MSDQNRTAYAVGYYLSPFGLGAKTRKKQRG
jgi:hypothetical protein